MSNPEAYNVSYANIILFTENTKSTKDKVNLL